MRRFLLALIILALPHSSNAVQQIKYIGEIRAGQPLFIDVDEQGNIYTTQKNGTIRVLSNSGEVLFHIKGEDEVEKPIIKRPMGLDFYKDKIYITDEALGKVIIFSKNGKYLDCFGKKGSAPKEFNKPRGIFVYDGVIYVADSGNKRVQVFGQNGVYMGSIGIEGQQENMLKNPTDIAIDQNGLIYVVDNECKKVKVFDSAGNFLKNIDGTKEPYSIAIDKDGIYVADIGKYRINRYDFNGNRQFIFGSNGIGQAQFSSLAGISVKKEGKIYIVDTVRGIIHVFLPEWEERVSIYEDPSPPSTVSWLNDIYVKVNTIWAQNKEKIYAINEKEKNIVIIENKEVSKTLNLPECSLASIATDPQGFIWVLDKAKDRMLKLDENGKILFCVGSSGSKAGYFSDPADISISRKGIIFVADSGNNRVQAFNTDGVFLNIIGEKDKISLMKKPLAIALDSNNNLYVLDRDKKTVSVYSQEGDKLMEFGSKSNLEWYLDNPVSITVTENEIFILDSGKNIVKVFTLSGKFLREFGAKGTGKGDFNKPSSIATINDTLIFISDTGNKRIQILKTIHTPAAPIHLEAKEGMKRVELKWEKSQESFVNMYRVYRSEHNSIGFREIANTQEDSYTDCDVISDKEYFYIVRAVAKEGNIGLKSAVVSAKPFKVEVSKPSGLEAQTSDRCVYLSWEPSNTDFTSYYIIYKEEDGTLKEVGKTEDTQFTDMFLYANTSYRYWLSVISIDGVESEKVSIKATTQVSTRPPLEIEVIHMHDIFSNTYKIYENEGIGTINLINNTNNHISKLKVSFSIKEFMDFPWEIDIEDLTPFENRGFVIKAVFNNTILNITEDTPVQTELKVSYYDHGEIKTFSKNHTINIYEKHRMGWDEKDRIATFITPKDSAILEFTRSIVTQYGDYRYPIVFASAIFDALGIVGLTYMQDPSNPYQVTSEKTDFVDYIQYPRETLKRKSGDCDDLVILYSAALESIGIPTKLLFYPGHVLMMFSTGIKCKDKFDTLENMVVELEGNIWIPVETTLLGESFIKAWEVGSTSYYNWRENGLEIMDIKFAWKKFKPASLPISSWRSEIVNKDTIEKEFVEESNTVRKIHLRLISKKYIALLSENPNDVNALMQLGIIYAQAGVTEEAKKAFEKALEYDKINADLKNNIGNIHFLNKDYTKAQLAYEEAAKRDPEDPYILINLTKCYLKLEMEDKAKEVFKKAIEIDSKISSIYKTLSLKFMSVL
ncbi:MAG: 6-bladed beta-propeller [Thermodesulfobacteriota bacterium]|nr:6-bladed beta-propeller [Thermodesulfobacteriota bacterium]